jgi:hypothetical protein
MKGMSVAELQARFCASQRVYSADETKRRRRRFRDQLAEPPQPAPSSSVLGLPWRTGVSWEISAD